jgi:hypothetical protein
LIGLTVIKNIVGNLEISSNTVITNLTGLEGLKTIGGSLEIFANDVMINLTGLDNLTSIGGELNINYNWGLISLSGLEFLTSIGGDIWINENFVLTSISGINNINASTITNLHISRNFYLQECDVQSLCDYLVSPNGSVDIYQNGTACNNPNEVANACGISTVCLPYGNYYFLTQSEIDSFPSNYPNCTDLEGFVMITDDIYNLNGLSAVSSISGDLRIGYWPEWWGTWHLKDLAGLENLSFIDGNLYICSNSELNSLAGLENLTSIGGSLTIFDNDSLNSVSELLSLNSIGTELYLNYNSVLESLSGLDNIDADSMTDLYIYNNHLLTTCEVLCVCDYLAGPNGIIEIHDNAPGCNTQAEVEAACEVGLNEIPSENLFTISPNPSSSQIIIETTTLSSKFQLSIFNLNGQEVIQRQMTESKKVIDISALPAGVYFVRMTGAKVVGIEKFVKID